tara:strand:- start:636 stop:881 length:246 start_codon:yes stop_codon:yes gene_type:complete
MNSIYINCPHCKQVIEVLKSQFNCKIFRHGVFKDTYTQIDPHLPKVQCDKLVAENKIYGCGKPFRLVIEGNKFKTEICDYI